MDPRITRHKLATVTLGPRNVFLINDLKLAKSLFDREDFSGRESTEWDQVLKMMNGKLRGIIHTEAECSSLIPQDHSVATQALL